jgi:serine/threonine protein kinase
VLSDSPAWWNSTAKAKAIAGIALGLRFAHGFGLLHGDLKASNVLFDADRRIQIADFSPIRLERGDAEPFSGEGWSPTADVCALVSLLLNIAVSGSEAQPGAAPPIPGFVSAIIEGWSSPYTVNKEGKRMERKSHNPNQYEERDEAECSSPGTVLHSKPSTTNPSR